MTLPKDDLPDTYTGIWNRVKITHIVPDTHQGVYHLVMPGDKIRTFCTVTNPGGAPRPPGGVPRVVDTVLVSVRQRGLR